MSDGGGTKVLGFIKDGTGILTLTGNSTYTGETTISHGTLIIGDVSHATASVSGNVTVSSGGTLKGYGSVAGSLMNSGIVAPGATSGSLTANSYTQNSGGTLALQLAPTQNSSLIVTNTATVGGTLSITPSAGTYTRNTIYPVMTAGGGISGTFATLINNSPSVVKLSLQYLANEIDIIANGTTAFTSIASGRNQSGVASALDAVSPTLSSGPTNNLVNAIIALPTSSQTQALNQLNNHVATQTGFTSMRLQSGAMGARALNTAGFSSPTVIGENGPMMLEVQIADGLGNNFASDMPSNIPLFSQGLTAWLQGIGTFSSINASGSGPGVNSSTGGFSAGIERHISHPTRIGLMFGATRESIGIQDVGQSATLASYSLGLYGSHDLGPVTVDGSGLISYNHATSDRQIAVLSQTAHGVSDGFGLGFDAGISHRFGLSEDSTLLPRLGLNYTHTHQGSYTETGAPGANLAVSAQTQSLLQSDLGATLDMRYQLSGNTTTTHILVPHIHAGWLHEWFNPAAKVQQSFADLTSASFTTYGINQGRDAASLAVGATYVPGFGEDLSFYINYDAVISPDARSHTVIGGMKINW